MAPELAAAAVLALAAVAVLSLRRRLLGWARSPRRRAEGRTAAQLLRLTATRARVRWALLTERLPPTVGAHLIGHLEAVRSELRLPWLEGRLDSGDSADD